MDTLLGKSAFTFIFKLVYTSSKRISKPTVCKWALQFNYNFINIEDNPKSTSCEQPKSTTSGIIKQISCTMLED